MAVLEFGLGWKQPVAPPGRSRVLMFPKVSALCNFKVTKKPPLLVTPNRSTPSHPLYLTNIDNQLGLRVHMNTLLFYGSPCGSSSMKNQEDPVHIIEEALAKLLVHYYPFAGRVRDADDKGNLMVDCTSKGVLLVEADADISLEEFGVLSPPLPRALDFINYVPLSKPITESPLLLFQVTRLKCGGFILGVSFNHTVTDGVGMTQFLKALGEIARGAASPTVPPVWNREILRPREKPMANYPGVREYYDSRRKHVESMVQVPAVPQEMEAKSFYFGSKEIAALRGQAVGVKHPTPFELISACLWRSREKALDIPGDQISTIMFPYNARPLFRPRLPRGYYGNVIVPAYAMTKSRDLTHQPLSSAVKLINEGKGRVKEEYVRSFIDLAELNGCPHGKSYGVYGISDVSKIMVDCKEVDFGWGKAAYASPVYPGAINVPYLIRPSVNAGEGFLVPVSLPSTAMQVFEQEINNATNGGWTAASVMV